MTENNSNPDDTFIPDQSLAAREWSLHVARDLLLKRGGAGVFAAGASAVDDRFGLDDVLRVAHWLLTGHDANGKVPDLYPRVTVSPEWPVASASSAIHRLEPGDFATDSPRLSVPRIDPNNVPDARPSGD